MTPWLAVLFAAAVHSQAAAAPKAAAATKADAAVPSDQGATSAAPEASSSAEAAPDEQPGGDGQSLADLERSRVIGTTASLDALRAALVAAQQDLVTGNVQAATLRLFALVEAPAYRKFKDDPEYQNAELTLGRALVRAGAYGAAERYLQRVLARGPKQPFFGPAYRAMVDIALETREEAAALTRVDAAAGGAALPKDASNERAYLAGKAAYGAGQLSQAARQFEEVDRQSRFFAAALYFRGLIDARSKHYASARRNLCEIVEQADRERFTFFVDGRYFAIKDLAFLALGRIAHEQGKYDDAYYFYFRVPEDSERLPEALYEASWSMFQKGEYEAARAFIEQFDRSFPVSPLAPDVLLLRAMINLKSCRFDDVRTTLDTFVRTYVPIQAQVAELIADPTRRGALYRRLLGRQRIGRGGDPIFELLKLDARFYRYYAYVLDLDREAGLVPQAVAVWDELTAARAGDGGGAAAAKQTAAEARGAQATEAVALMAEIDDLVGEAAALRHDDPELHDDARELLQAARRAARPTSPAGPFADEAEQLSALGAEARKLRKRLVEAVSALAESALVDLDRRLRGLLRQARLTHIDAVIGKKKRLEIEIANLQEGRYPTELLGRLESEGLIGDDEEYWPYEGEYWADEYENFR